MTNARLTLFLDVLMCSFTMQLSKIDARIMKKVTEMQKLELKLGPISAYDYRVILLPLVKSYLRVCIQTAETCTAASPFV